MKVVVRQSERRPPPGLRRCSPKVTTTTELAALSVSKRLRCGYAIAKPGDEDALEKAAARHLHSCFQVFHLPSAATHARNTQGGAFDAHPSLGVLNAFELGVFKVVSAPAALPVMMVVDPIENVMVAVSDATADAMSQVRGGESVSGMVWGDSCGNGTDGHGGGGGDDSDGDGGVEGEEEVSSGVGGGGGSCTPPSVSGPSPAPGGGDEADAAILAFVTGAAAARALPRWPQPVGAADAEQEANLLDAAKAYLTARPGCGLPEQQVVDRMRQVWNPDTSAPPFDAAACARGLPRRSATAMVELALTFNAVNGSPVLIVSVMGAPACAMTDDGHCVGVVGSPEEKAAQHLYRGSVIALAHKVASQKLPDAPIIPVVLLGRTVANAVMKANRKGESGYASSTSAPRFRMVDTRDGRPPMPVAALPAGTPVALVYEFMANMWSAVFGNTVAITRNAHLHLQLTLRLVNEAGWGKAGTPAEEVINVTLRFDTAAQLESPEKVAATLAARSAQAATPSRLIAQQAQQAHVHAALTALTTRRGLRAQPWHDRRVRVQLGARTVLAVVELPRADRRRDVRLRLQPGEPLVLYLDTSRRRLYVSRDPCPDAPAVLLLAVLPAPEELLDAADLASVAGDFPVPQRGPPCWVGRGLLQGTAAAAAVAAAEADDAGAAARDAARLLARADYSVTRPMMGLAAAEAQWRAVALAAEEHNEADSAFMAAEAAAAKLRAASAASARRSVEAGELEFAEEAAACVNAAHAAGVADPLNALPLPRPPLVEEVQAAEPPPRWLLKKLGLPTMPPPFPFRARPALFGVDNMATNAFQCMTYPTLKGIGKDATRLFVSIQGVLGQASIVLATVPTAEYAQAGVAASLAALACGTTAPLPVPVRLLQPLLGDEVVQAVLALPQPQGDICATAAPLHWAAVDAARALFDFACRLLEARREPEEAAACREALLDWTGDLRRLLEADFDGARVAATHPPERQEAARAGISGYAYVSEQAGRNGSTYYAAQMDKVMGLATLGCNEPTAEKAARTVDALRIVVGPGRDNPGTLSFKLHEYPLDLLPRMPAALARRDGDTPELAALRDDLLRPLVRIVSRLVASRFLGGGDMAQSVADALTAHARRLADELRAAADAAAGGGAAVAALRAWLATRGAQASSASGAAPPPEQPLPAAAAARKGSGRKRKAAAADGAGPSKAPRTEAPPAPEAAPLPAVPPVAAADPLFPDVFEGLDAATIARAAAELPPISALPTPPLPPQEPPPPPAAAQQPQPVDMIAALGLGVD